MTFSILCHTNNATVKFLKEIRSCVFNFAATFFLKTLLQQTQLKINLRQVFLAYCAFVKVRFFE